MPPPAAGAGVCRWQKPCHRQRTQTCWPCPFALELGRSVPRGKIRAGLGRHTTPYLARRAMRRLSHLQQAHGLGERVSGLHTAVHVMTLLERRFLPPPPLSPHLSLSSPQLPPSLLSRRRATSRPRDATHGLFRQEPMNPTHEPAFSASSMTVISCPSTSAKSCIHTLLLLPPPTARSAPMPALAASCPQTRSRRVRNE